VSALTHDFAAVMAAGKCYRGHILRLIVTATNFAIFSTFWPFFILAATKWLFSCSAMFIANFGFRPCKIKSLVLLQKIKSLVFISTKKFLLFLVLKEQNFDIVMSIL
jgi:hypothetical protein